ncbi:MAG: hypothetical protein AB1400_08830 [Pseudomonadota bacterium]|jgi:hypothetical protein
MTIPRLKEMTAYWRQNPPLHLMVAAYFGAGESPPKENKQQDLSELLGNIPMVQQQPRRKPPST